MVYCGAVSKGCERCRKRKIKCDGRRPMCLRCERSNIQCLGYRDIGEVIFRNESLRVATRVRRLKASEEESKRDNHSASPMPPEGDQSDSRDNSAIVSSLCNDITPSLSIHTEELGASFFFAKYTHSNGPFLGDYHAWVTRSYLEDEPNAGLRAAVKAVGLSGLANVFHASHIAAKASEQYGNALKAMTLALNDTTQATADTTLLTVNLLGLFETLNCETWDRRCYWAAHMKAAMALLKLRGQDQFTRERGAQLYVQIRAQILSACMQQCINVPPALVQSTFDFQFSPTRSLWRSRDVASRGSLTEISFRLTNLWAAFKNNTIHNPTVVTDAALAIDHDLEAWTEGITPGWRYTTIDAPGVDDQPDVYFEGKAHVYANLWVARVWNSWRGLRIIVNQIIEQNGRCASAHNDTIRSNAISTIQKLSTELCVAVSSFRNSSPDLLSLIEALCHIALEEINSYSVRLFAIQQLRHIDISVGVRQARLLADAVSQRLKKASTDLMLDQSHSLILESAA